MNNRLYTKIMMGFFFVSGMPLCAMNTKVLEEKPHITVDITTKSMALGRTVDGYIFGDENRKKCDQLGWIYKRDDTLIEVAISCKDSDGQIIDCLKTNPSLLRRALLRNVLNDQSKGNTLINDLRRSQFPRYIPMYVLTAEGDLIFEMYGCPIKANIFFADGLDSSIHLKNTLCLVAGGLGLTLASFLLLLENIKLFGA